MITCIIVGSRNQRLDGHNWELPSLLPLLADSLKLHCNRVELGHLTLPPGLLTRVRRLVFYHYLFASLCSRDPMGNDFVSVPWGVADVRSHCGTSRQVSNDLPRASSDKKRLEDFSYPFPISAIPNKAATSRPSLRYNLSLLANFPNLPQTFCFNKSLVRRRCHFGHHWSIRHGSTAVISSVAFSPERLARPHCLHSA